MELYERTARVINPSDAQLCDDRPASHGFGNSVGVPPWGAEFLKSCAERNLPLDFYSTHPYATFYPVDLGCKALTHVINVLYSILGFQLPVLLISYRLFENFYLDTQVIWQIELLTRERTPCNRH